MTKPTIQPIKRVLVANRAEIAVRVIRTCRDLGITSVAVYSDIDRRALHVQLADEAYPLGGTTAAESYLNQERLLDIAHQARVDAIHPGYGFLSENPQFAEAVEREGIRFIGPSAKAMALLGDKTQARKIAFQHGVPTIPGSKEAFADETEGLKIAEEIGFPVLLKASAGGGGKGMRVVHSSEEFIAAVRGARSEAKAAFGDDRLYVEKYLPHPRHIEIQVLVDQYGHAIYLGERECSIQRRHQKVIEETPSPFLTEELRQRMGEAAVTVVKAASYANAGTVEFLVDSNRDFYFLEVNTRLQVEHPVTELVTGLDLVEEQIRIAEGHPLQRTQEQVRRTGHAIECRIYAEDPENSFFPSTGMLRHFRPPQGPGVRVDNGFLPGDSVSVYYDPLLAKVITWGRDREQAIAIMRRALSEFLVDGVKTTIPFCQFVLRAQEFLSGKFDTHFVQDHFAQEQLYHDNEVSLQAAAVAAVLTLQQTSPQMTVPSGRTSSNWKGRRGDYYRT
jgi:acetyl-CoA carboxylase biotin carboxylase subunit